MFLSIINKSSPSSTVFPLLDSEDFTKRTKYTNDQIIKLRIMLHASEEEELCCMHLPSNYYEIKLKICKSKVYEITVKLMGSPKM